MPPDTLTLHISRYDFSIPSRYTPGHSLTEGEAKALNQLMMENIRNNVAPWIRAAESKAPKGVLTLATHEALQIRIEAYANAYQFIYRTPRRPLSAIEAAIDELSSAKAESEGTASGYAPDSPEVQLRYRQLLADPDIRTKARLIVAERARLTQDALTDILGFSPTEEPTR